MEKTRAIYFYNDDSSTWQFEFGTYALAMYYAKQLGSSTAKKLFDATLSEEHYRIYNDIPYDDIEDDDPTAHFVIGDIEEVLNFINKQMIPALTNETQDLIEKYGGAAAFVEKYKASDAEYLNELFLYDEYYNSDPDELASYMGYFGEFLQYALDTNKPYEVSVR